MRALTPAALSAISGELREYDYFGQQKRDTLKASMMAIALLGEHLLETVAEPTALSAEQVKRAFSDFIGVSRHQWRIRGSVFFLTTCSEHSLVLQLHRFLR